MGKLVDGRRRRPARDDVGVVLVVAVGASGSARAGAPWAGNTAGSGRPARPARPAAGPARHPGRLADPLPAGRRHLPGAALVGAGRHRHRRVGKRPVDGARGRGRAPTRAGAEGPMQFEPATFAAYATVGPGRRPAGLALRPGRRRLHGRRPAVRRRGRLASTLRRRHRRLQPLRPLRGHRADPVPRRSNRTRPPRARWWPPCRSPPSSWAPPTCGAAPAPVGSTAPGLVQAAYRPRRDQPPPGGPGPVRRRAAGPGRRHRSSPATWSSSGPDRPASTTSGSTWATGEMIDAPHTGALVRFDAADWPDWWGPPGPAGAKRTAAATGTAWAGAGQP